MGLFIKGYLCNKHLLLSCFLVCAFYSSSSMVAQKSIHRQQVLSSLLRVNSYFMEKYSDYTATSNVGRVRPSNIWIGVFIMKD
ncbi:hypothetical protein [Saccharicrinis fermentans]|uniref:Secreted protein n=1 Tax=Saccharicrinis fermentans DSM 9555 = JCM 21142 TaxID=869213 RepID=W7YCE4_9BACT|nr:hypothetical protein [Saccharicrinis fermentans]GAF02116.1 hypothetical protein JCM21142_2743 [Saccharicrinis fermentans DSM 9555 = JCM 21142]